MSTPPRRFPPPWRVEDAGDGEVLRVVDAGGQILAYVLYEDEPIRRELMKRLTKDEARRIAANHRQAAGAAGGVKGIVSAIVSKGTGAKPGALIPQPGECPSPLNIHPVEMPLAAFKGPPGFPQANSSILPSRQ